MSVGEDYDTEQVVLVRPGRPPRPPRTARPAGTSRPPRTARPAGTRPPGPGRAMVVGPTLVPDPVVEPLLTDHNGHWEQRAAKQPLLVRLLRLQHVRPTGWQRAAVGDFPILVAVLLVLADLATAWTLLVLPVAVLALVKFHDLIESRLAPVPTTRPAKHAYGEARDR